LNENEISTQVTSVHISHLNSQNVQWYIDMVTTTKHAHIHSYMFTSWRNYARTPFRI